MCKAVSGFNASRLCCGGHIHVPATGPCLHGCTAAHCPLCTTPFPPQGRYSFVGSSPALEVVAVRDKVVLLDHAAGTRTTTTMTDPMQVGAGGGYMCRGGKKRRIQTLLRRRSVEFYAERRHKA